MYTPLKRPWAAFTLIELLVVISVIALLVGILLPALGAARRAAQSSASLSNMRQMGIAVGCYQAENDSYYPLHEGWYYYDSGDPSARRRTHWPDHLFMYMSTPEIYLSPTLTESERAAFTTRFVDNRFWSGSDYTGPFYGGYGWNYQYVGNERAGTFGTPYYARADVVVKAASDTIVLGDTAGSRAGAAGAPSTAFYVIDPPRASVTLGSRGSRHSSGGAYYRGGSEENTSNSPEDTAWDWRAFPAERNNGSAGFTFADGHGALMKRTEVDDFDGDGATDNGYWNGFGDPTRY